MQDNTKNFIKRAFITLAIVTPILFGTAAAMVHMDNPDFSDAGPRKPMSAQTIADLGFEQKFTYEPHPFTARDGVKIFGRKYTGGNTDTVIIQLHGVLADGFQSNQFAGNIRNATNATVYSIDLRGHGMSGGKPGDLSYTDQYRDDMADIVKHVRTLHPDSKVMVAGHSMGGGILLRYAMIDDAPEVDGYILFAPLLGQDAPTMEQPNSVEKQSGGFMKVHIPRLIALAFLNTFGFDVWNHKPVMFFNLPKEAPLHTYSFNAAASMSPAHYRDGLQAIDKPLFVTVGSHDTTFNSMVYGPVVRNNTDGTFYLTEGATHNGVRHDIKAMDALREWVKANS
ncbi:alpha/beta fold hydrolase [Kordiimonas sp. SCSIO 12603]|uniref:alpha/beta hydrolase n=1 Tax=Kordiimonas sp. SCSIO 12603 TaxID=2829596 RepID=UPI002107453E|nr:alpha/beta fold hydrolase [Kordiimonas sp. SCSIO 12603]UTW59812.1 alpha/beta fold hydrolase [Kordiimonas sp. SCSIO 12603]